ncbi:MAG TPA: glycosyltransferase family 4 protein [Allosphingosinicella sp.]|jgi:hypothetical protein|nr:glycosyltransferase family 4 protein [Allosphingosinicella sp.]
MRIAAFMKYGDAAASTRQRLKQYEQMLRHHGIEVEYFPLLDNEHLRNITRGIRTSRLSLVKSYVRRFAAFFGLARFDVVWVHCELFPYLPGVFEKIAFRPGLPVVYDYDDAIFHMYDEVPNAFVRRALCNKLVPLMSRASVCLCGNPYLHDYARRQCSNAIILPTVVDTDSYVPVDERSPEGPPVIGWIGSPSTWRYVRPLMPMLEAMAASGRARVRIVGASAAGEPDRSAHIEMVDWEEAREIADIQNMDIGIMPLPDESWARGKSGYKLIQYMACGLPVIASPVGVNQEIVTSDCGFLASDEEGWRQAFERLLRDADLRRRLGANGRKRIVERYSLAAHAPRLLAALQALDDRGTGVGARAA